MKKIADKFFYGDEKRMYIYTFLSFVFLVSMFKCVYAPNAGSGNGFYLVTGFFIGITLCAEFKNCMEAYKAYEELEKMKENRQPAMVMAKKRQKQNPAPKKRIPDKTNPVFEVEVKEVRGAKPIKEAAMDFLNRKKSKPNADPKSVPGHSPDIPKDSPEPIVKSGQSNAEKKGNVIIGDDGKAVVKPNYKMIASEWVTANLDLLNKICNDAFLISGGEGSYKATIPKNILPPEQAAWIIIGKTLQDGDDIANFAINKNGLEITVE